MPDFLLEIGCEEIPARMLDGARDEIERRVRDLLARESLIEPIVADDRTQAADHGYLTSYSTPRRLAVRAQRVASSQPDVQEQLTGPATRIAFKDGKPTPAAEAFARKAGVQVAKLETITTPKGEYLSATVVKKGRRAAEVLAELLPKEIAGIYWAKNMYWRPGKPERFVRPVRWLVAMLDDQVVPLEFAGIRAGSETRGHRILSSGTEKIARAGDYHSVLANAKVQALAAEREQRIRKALDAATRTVAGARWREDAELLNTVVNLTEWPSAILGGFDQQFLSLPEEVLVTVMRDHQKYFAVEDASGKLAPHFLAVLNTDGDPDGLIRHGNERVLRARFNDARFFWDTDQKLPLTARVDMLKAVTFQKDLGSYAAKSERMLNLVEQLCVALTKAGLKVDAEAAQQAAKLAKTDLTTELVKEFTELQGIIGGLYAKAQGLPQPVADAIYDQYKPESMEDSVPRTLEGAVLSIADKADSIAGMFALGLLPSGSKDPFALRRQANGIVKTIAEHKLPIKLSTLIGAAANGYEDHPKLQIGSGPRFESALRDALQGFIPSEQSHSLAAPLAGFFRERIEFYFREKLGFAYDIVGAVLSVGSDDITDAERRASAVVKAKATGQLNDVFVAFKRANSILKQDPESLWDRQVDESGLTERAEQHLFRELLKVSSAFRLLCANGDYFGGLMLLAQLRPAIDAFFDQVRVVDSEPQLRRNRFALLRKTVTEFFLVADLSQIVPTATS